MLGCPECESEVEIEPECDPTRRMYWRCPACGWHGIARSLTAGHDDESEQGIWQPSPEMREVLDGAMRDAIKWREKMDRKFIPAHF